MIHHYTCHAIIANNYEEQFTETMNALKVLKPSRSFKKPSTHS